MSMEVLGQDASTILPYAATIGGATFGVAGEFIAQHRVQVNRQPTVAEYGAVFSNVHESTGHKIRRHVIAPLAFFGLVAGGFNGIAWVEQPSQETVPPQIEVAVDHSGATALNGGVAQQEIQKIVDKFNDESSVRADVVLASFGTIKEVKISDVAKDNPLGDALMDQATSTAIDGAIKSKAQASANSQIKNSGVLVITNGNSLGSTQEVILKARASNVPVFVANVEDKGTDPQVTSDLQDIAKGTYGKYWDINSSNVDKVAPAIEDALAPKTVEHKNNQNKWTLRIFAGAASLLGFGVIFRKRGKMTLANNVKKG